MSDLILAAYERPFLQWTNALPVCWERKRFKHLGTFIGGGTPSKDNEAFWKGNIPWVSPKDMKASVIVDTEDHISKQAIDVSSTSLLPIGCLLIVVRSGILKHTIPIATNAVPVTLNQDMKGFVPGKSILSQYLLYLIQGNQDTFLLEWRKAGATVESLENEFLTDTILPVPPLPEQRAIAAFLDQKTAQIDAVVTKKQRLIELLQEKRQALISHAVTKGLDSNVSMKDSGIEWLGEIPAHWSLKPLGSIVNIFGGSTPSKTNENYWTGGNIPWVSPKDMKRWEIDDSEDHITNVALAESGISLIRPPATLLVVRGMILARDVPVSITTVPVTINQDMKALVARPGCSAEFLGLLLRAVRQAFFALVEESGHGTRCLRTELWRRLPLPIPPIEDQKSICDFVHTEFERSTGIERRLADQIVKLQEYRQTLISAAVTGKIDVTRVEEATPGLMGR